MFLFQYILSKLYVNELIETSVFIITVHPNIYLYYFPQDKISRITF